MRTVVVVGGGLAGQSAAIEAARAGAKVILLEKEPRLGGNSAKATSGINAWGTKAQAEQGVEDSAKYFERDTFLSGKGGNSQAGLVKMLSQKSADAIQWLTSFDIPLTVLSQLGGASRKRCHRAPEKPDGTPLPIGFTIIKAMEKQLKETFAGDVTLEMNAKLRRLLSETITLPNGESAVQVSGVEYLKGASPDQEGEVVQLRADAVILATGGFSNDHTTNSLLEQYAPQLAEFPTTNGPWATGDGVKAARELNVALVDMDKVQLHPTGLLNPKDPNAKTVFLGPEALRGSGGILLNKKGERFINELDLRSVVSKAIIDQNDVYPDTTRKFAFCVLNDEAASLFGRGTLEFYWKKFGLFTYAEDVKALAELIGVPEEKVAASLSEYEALSTGKERCPLTGKSVYPCVLGPKGPFYVAYVTPSIHYTMGGCLISPSAEILSAEVGVFGSRKPIYGLFGAGEVSGGVHGGNRLGGNSLLECVVFGRIAGRRASEVTAVASPALTNDWVSAVVREILPEDSAQAQGLTEGSRLLEIALPSPLAVSGLSPLQTLALRLGTKTAVVRPASSPHQLGSVLVALPPSLLSPRVGSTTCCR
ncbi:NADH-dependent fumarate reductase [Angomonas deanei]|nr:NADH-dependent fumarate reductase [Angomonas deanei]|eukprot:EPY29097.1 NADH-dependent fumarate reductase [Angomonas deanei]